MPSVLSRPLFRQNGGEIAEPGQGFVKRATQGARRWDPLTNGEERRHRAQLDIYNNFTPEQRRHVGLLTETGLSVEDAIFEVWSEAKRAIGSDMLYRPPPPDAPMVSPEPMPPMPSGVTRGFPEPLPPMPPMVSPAPMPPMVSPAPMPPMVSPAPPPDFSEFNQGGPALAPQAMMAPPVGMPPMGMPPEAMMAPPVGMPPQAMVAPPVGMPPQAMGMPAGISPEDEALLGGVAQLGEDYVHDMLSGLDTADTPESLINALRGNDLPLEARYNELAQLVGPEDAQATPESVLALVQPTLMLVDAGVGSLMPGVAGETEMMTESGAPTPMGEGVGNLMMAGAPPPDMMMAGAPPPDMMMANQVSPQGFWRGGPVVQRFQDGNGVNALGGTIGATYGQTLPLVEDIIGSDPDYTRGMALLSAARGFGNWAAGTSPTGENIAHLSPGAQFASNLGGFAGDVGTLAAAQRQEGQAAKLAALNLAGTLASRETYDFETLGNRLYRVNKVTGDSTDITDQVGGGSGGTFLGKSYRAMQDRYLTDSDLLKRYSKGETTEDEDLLLNQIFTNQTQGYMDEVTGRVVPAGSLSSAWTAAIADRARISGPDWVAPRYTGKDTPVSLLSPEKLDALRLRLAQ
jgi:hypothetical protein